MGQVITLTEALVKLKTLKKQVEKSLGRAETVVDVEVNNKLVFSQIPKNEFKPIAQSRYDKACKLYENMVTLKERIAIANAINTVTVRGQEYTISGAIIRKQLASYELDFYQNIQAQINNALDYVTRRNEEIEAEITELLKSRLENAQARDMKIDEIAQSLKAMKEAKIFDPLKLREVVEVKIKDIQDFLDSVDVALSVANATIKIEMPD